MKRILLGTLCLALVSSPTFAKGKPQGNKEHKVEKSHFKDDKDKRDKDRDKDDKDDKDKHDKAKTGKDWKDRDHRDASGRPAGWDKGKKTGWGDCDVPPGQAKKVGCQGNRDRHVGAHRTERHKDRTVATNRDRVRTRSNPTPNTTTTKATTTAAKGQHPFEPTLRRKQTEDAQRRNGPGPKTK